ncbi:MAG: hypothetical protein P8J86_07785 [Phycisphaerales bacterium]|nr:hypothetical protein [Phycisphaerales bacterium]
MKVRIQTNSIRFRLEGQEVEDLISLGRVCEQLTLPCGTTFNLLLNTQESLQETRISAGANAIAVDLDREILTKWNNSQSLSLKFDLQSDVEGDSLTILVEKDLPCQSH